MLSLTIEVFVLYSVDGFDEGNKAHHQKHNLHLVKQHKIVSLIFLSKYLYRCKFTNVISEWDCISKIFHLQREHPRKIAPFLFLLSSCTSSCCILRIIYYTSPKWILIHSLLCGTYFMLRDSKNISDYFKARDWCTWKLDFFVIWGMSYYTCCKK